MIVNMRTTVATVNIAFSSSKNAALIERKMLQYTTLSIKLQHCTLSEIKPKFSYCQTSLLVSQYNARIKNNTQTETF